jgi:hypothetical protein
MFASILSVAHNLGYPTLVLLVMLESSGVPLPGETALITAAVLASQHRLQIEHVIALAAAAAIAGDNAGYLIGRKGGRWLLLRPGPFARHRARVLEQLRQALPVGIAASRTPTASSTAPMKRSLPRARHRLGAVLPPWLRIPRQRGNRARAWQRCRRRPLTPSAWSSCVVSAGTHHAHEKR